MVDPAVVVLEPEVVIVHEPAAEVVVFREPPPLVLVESNVYVVQNSGVAIYFVDGFYWNFHSGVWFHACRWDDPWVRVETHIVPVVIAHRDHRHYVHFKGSAKAQAKVWRQPKATARKRTRSQGRGACGPHPSSEGRRAQA